MTTTITIPRHPAKFADKILTVADGMLPSDVSVLDPFAGVGGIHKLATNGRKTAGVEIEPDWAVAHPSTIVGDALALPFADGTFDWVFTSPCYGNRMADHHTPSPEDTSTRNTYTHAIGHKLASNNAGAFQWGDQYRQFHLKALMEMWRVSTDGLILNLKDHIRKDEVQPVTQWWLNACDVIGWRYVMIERVELKGNRQGKNGEKRVDFETVTMFLK